jgi:hypothetical protein
MAVAIVNIGLTIIPISAADSIPKLVAKAKPATIQIIALDDNWYPVKTGTGFFISPDGLAVTNYHVVLGASHLTARTNVCLANQVRALPQCVAFDEFVDTRRVVEIAPLSVPSPDGSAASPDPGSDHLDLFSRCFSHPFSPSALGASNLNSNARCGIRRSDCAALKHSGRSSK